MRGRNWKRSNLTPWLTTSSKANSQRTNEFHVASRPKPGTTSCDRSSPPWVSERSATVKRRSRETFFSTGCQVRPPSA